MTISDILKTSIEFSRGQLGGTLFYPDNDTSATVSLGDVSYEPDVTDDGVLNVQALEVIALISDFTGGIPETRKTVKITSTDIALTLSTFFVERTEKVKGMIVLTLRRI